MSYSKRGKFLTLWRQAKPLKVPNGICLCLHIYVQRSHSHSRSFLNLLTSHLHLLFCTCICKKNYNNHPYCRNMDKSDRFIFINGPCLVSMGTIKDRRRIRSQLMRRVFLERMPPEKRSQELLNPHVDESIDEFALSMREDHHRPASSSRSKRSARSRQGNSKSGLIASSSSNGDGSCCAFCRAIIKAGHETGTSTVCNQCGEAMEMAINTRHNNVIHRTKRDIDRIVHLHLTRLADAQIDPFGGPANGRGNPGYYQLLDHCRCCSSSS